MRTLIASLVQTETLERMKTVDNGRVQADLIQRLKRIEGQVRGLQKMVDEKRACEDILVQLMAVRAALDTVTAQLVVSHTSQCMEQLPSDEAKVAVGRAIRLLTKMP